MYAGHSPVRFVIPFPIVSKAKARIQTVGPKMEHLVPEWWHRLGTHVLSTDDVLEPPDVSLVSSKHGYVDARSQNSRRTHHAASPPNRGSRIVVSNEHEEVVIIAKERIESTHRTRQANR